MRITRLRHRAGLSTELARTLELGREPVLAQAPLVGGGVVVATGAGLRMVTPRGEIIRRRWVDIDHVVWHPDSATLAVFWVAGRLPTPLEIAEESFIPEVVHERWRASVLLVREVPLPGLASAWMALRRDRSGAEETIEVQTNLPPGVDPTDDAVSGLLDRARRALRAEIGLGPEGDSETVGGALPGPM